MEKTDIHSIQAKILCNLLFKKSAKFSELNKDKISSDLFSFHLKQLNDWGLVQKNSQDHYQLTTKGKEYANRFDTDKNEIERQAKIGVVIMCMRNGKNMLEYLVQKRLKQPYYGFWGSITGKVKWGETIFEAATRELKEETGLSGNLELVGIKHKLDYANNDGRLLEDKYFYVIRVTEIRGILIKNFEGGKNQWMEKSKIFSLKDLFVDVKETINWIENTKLEFSENKYKVDKY